MQEIAACKTGGSDAGHGCIGEGVPAGFVSSDDERDGGGVKVGGSSVHDIGEREVSTQTPLSIPAFYTVVPVWPGDEGEGYGFCFRQEVHGADGERLRRGRPSYGCNGKGKGFGEGLGGYGKSAYGRGYGEDIQGR